MSEQMFEVYIKITERSEIYFILSIFSCFFFWHMQLRYKVKSTDMADYAWQALGDTCDTALCWYNYFAHKVSGVKIKATGDSKSVLTALTFKDKLSLPVVTYERWSFVLTSPSCPVLVKWTVGVGLCVST